MILWTIQDKKAYLKIKHKITLIDNSRTRIKQYQSEDEEKKFRVRSTFGFLRVKLMKLQILSLVNNKGILVFNSISKIKTTKEYSFYQSTPAFLLVMLLLKSYLSVAVIFPYQVALYPLYTWY